MPLSVLKDIRKIYAGLNAGGIRAAELSVVLWWRPAAAFIAIWRTSSLLPARATARSGDDGMVQRLDKPEKGFDILLCEAGRRDTAKWVPFRSGGSDGALIEAVVAENQDIELALARSFPGVPSSRRAPDYPPRFEGKRHAGAGDGAAQCDSEFHRTAVGGGRICHRHGVPYMNQIRMALMMAAVYDRPIGYSEQKLPSRPLQPGRSDGGPLRANWSARFRWAAA